MFLLLCIPVLTSQLEILVYVMNIERYLDLMSLPKDVKTILVCFLAIMFSFSLNFLFVSVTNDILHHLCYCLRKLQNSRKIDYINISIHYLNRRVYLQNSSATFGANSEFFKNTRLGIYFSLFSPLLLFLYFCPFIHQFAPPSSHSFYVDY